MKTNKILLNVWSKTIAMLVLLFTACTYSNVPEEKARVSTNQINVKSSRTIQNYYVSGHHHQLLHSFANELYYLDPHYYTDQIDYSPDAYRIFKQFDTIMRLTTSSYLLYQLNVPSNSNYSQIINMINYPTPQYLSQLCNTNKQICENYSPFIAHISLDLYDSVTYYILAQDVVNNPTLFEARYEYFHQNISMITSSVLTHNIDPYYTTDAEIEIAECMTQTLEGSYSYWKNIDYFNIWRRHAWYANKYYLGTDSIIPYVPDPTLQFTISPGARAKLCDLLLNDMYGAGTGATIGSVLPGVGTVNGAIAGGAIASGLTALKW